MRSSSAAGLRGSPRPLPWRKAGLETVHLVAQGPARPPHLGADAAQRRLSASRPGWSTIRPRSAMPLTQIRIIDATRPADPRARDPVRQRRSRAARRSAGISPISRLLERFDDCAAAASAISRRSKRRSRISIAMARAATLTLANGETIQTRAAGRRRRQEVAGARESPGFRARENGFTQAALVCDLELGRPIGGASVEFHYPRARSRWCRPAATAPIWCGSTTARC